MISLRNIIMARPLTVEVCGHIFRSLKINLTKRTFSELLEAHPSYPSLLSIQDTMDFFRIPNKIVKYKQEKFGELECPFFVLIKDQISERKTLLSYVTSATAGFIVFFHPVKRKLARYNEEKFENLYQGIIILVESDAKVGEVDYEIRRRKEKKDEYVINILLWFLPMISIIGISQYLYSTSIDRNGWFLLFFFLLSLLGWSLSIVILIYERKTKPDNSLISKVCKRIQVTNTSIATDCRKVLQSAGSSLLWVKWSIWGFSYFTALAVAQLLFGLLSPSISVTLAGVALLISLYIIFSLYYQWKVLKSWCIMCLVVQLILSLQLLCALVLIQVTDYVNFSFSIALFFLLSVILISTATEFMVALIDRFQTLESLQRECLTNKYAPHVFFAKSRSQRQINIPLDGMGLTFGNPDANNRLVKVCNPYRGPCWDSHRVINRFLDDIPDLSVQIIFAGSKDFSDIRNRPIVDFLSLFECNDRQLMRSALDDWRLEPQKDYDAFAEKYPVMIDESSIKEKINSMSDWCDKMDISYSKTIQLRI